MTTSRVLAPTPLVHEFAVSAGRPASGAARQPASPGPQRRIDPGESGRAGVPVARTDGTTLDRASRTFVTKRQESILIRAWDEAHAPRLLEMYLAFQPRPCFQGLPPPKDETCRKWVEHTIESGINLVALAGVPAVVGHAALFPIDAARCEMLVVVSPEYQNAGIGTALVRASIELATERGFQRIWLPVEVANVRARHVYKNCGFEYLPGPKTRELEMAIELKRYRAACRR